MHRNLAYQLNIFVSAVSQVRSASLTWLKVIPIVQPLLVNLCMCVFTPKEENNFICFTYLINVLLLKIEALKSESSIPTFLSSGKFIVVLHFFLLLNIYCGPMICRVVFEGSVMQQWMLYIYTLKDIWILG